MLPLRAGYLAVFALAALACFGSIPRAVRITDSDTRRGLVGLLLCSGMWAAASAGRIAASSPTLQRASYMVGLIVGLASVGAWLYFCSAYAGYDYHHQRNTRRFSVAVFLAIVAVKLTNPVHSLYFTASVANEPFRHLSIELSVIHWTVTGLAYTLSGIGFYLLYELFRETQLETRRIGFLVGLTGAPAVVNIAAVAAVAPGVLLPFSYEPVAVALFAVGVLYVVDETFVAVPRRWRTEFVEQFSDPVLLVTRDGRVRDYNRVAVERYPALDGAVGRQLETVVPELHAVAAGSDNVVETRHDGETTFYTVQRTPLARGADAVGEVLVYRDVTDIERQRRERERQNEQLNDFSIALNHELRNAITVLGGFLDQSSQSVNGAVDFDSADVRRADDALSRMQRVIEELTTLAQYGQTAETTTECELGATAEAARAGGEFGSLSYSVERGATLVANHPRLEELLQEVFRFASANGATRVTIDVAGDVMTVTGNGEALSPCERSGALEFGPPVPVGDAEMALPTVRLLARVQGWTADIDPEYDDGVRLRIRGVTVRTKAEPAAE